jgi:ketosteroid isomerase-like protein
MLAASPSEAVALADAACNRGDLDGMLAFYEESAVMLFRIGQPVRGKEALGSVLKTLLALRPVASHDESHVIESGDLALWTSRWTVHGTAPDGSSIVRTGCGSAVFRRGPDGGWRVAIENPWGASVLDTLADTTA